MGHHGRTTAIPPNIRPLPSHLSQSGHLTGALGGSTGSVLDSTSSSLLPKSVVDEMVATIMGTPVRGSARLLAKAVTLAIKHNAKVATSSRREMGCLIVLDLRMFDNKTAMVIVSWLVVAMLWIDGVD